MWALDKHLALDKECGSPEQDCGPAAAPQGWEQNLVLVLSWGERGSRKSLCPGASPELDRMPSL